MESFITQVFEFLSRNIPRALGLGALAGWLAARGQPPGTQARTVADRIERQAGELYDNAEHEVRHSLRTLVIGSAVLVLWTVLSIGAMLTVAYLFHSRQTKTVLELILVTQLVLVWAVVFLFAIRPALIAGGATAVLVTGQRFLTWMNEVVEGRRNFGSADAESLPSIAAEVEQAHKRLGQTLTDLGVRFVDVIVFMYQRPLRLLVWVPIGVLDLILFDYAGETVFLWGIIGLIGLLVLVAAYKTKDRTTPALVLLQLCRWVLLVVLPVAVSLDEIAYYLVHFPGVDYTVSAEELARRVALANRCLWMMFIPLVGWLLAELVGTIKKNERALMAIRGLCLLAVAASILWTLFLVHLKPNLNGWWLAAAVVALIIVTFGVIGQVTGGKSAKGSNGNGGSILVVACIAGLLLLIVGGIALTASLSYRLLSPDNGRYTEVDLKKQALTPFDPPRSAAPGYTPLHPYYDHCAGDGSIVLDALVHKPVLLQQLEDRKYVAVRYPAGTKVRAKWRGHTRYPFVLRKSTGQPLEVCPECPTLATTELRKITAFVDQDGPVGWPTFNVQFDDKQVRSETIDPQGNEFTLTRPAIIWFGTNVEVARRGRDAMPYDTYEGKLLVSFELDVPTPTANTQVSVR